MNASHTKKLLKTHGIDLDALTKRIGDRITKHAKGETKIRVSTLQYLALDEMEEFRDSLKDKFENDVQASNELSEGGAQ